MLGTPSLTSKAMLIGERVQNFRCCQPEGIKRLFAHSGNRCAFPQCPLGLIQGETVVGEICHIRAAKPDGPRYDVSQTAEERHGYENLILLCPTHHTVIDADPESYTVEEELRGARRLLVRQGGNALLMIALHLDEALDQSVKSVSQSGGITAHTINLTIHSPQADDAEIVRRIHRFRDNRLGKITAGQPARELHHGACMVLHVVPLSSFADEHSTIDVVAPALHSGQLLLPPLGTGFGWAPQSYDIATNFDGVVTFTGRPQTSCYSQLFRSGAIEGVNQLGLDHNKAPFLAGTTFENVLVAGLRSYFRLLENLGIEAPVFVFISFCGVRGCNLRYSTAPFGQGQAGPISEPKIVLPAVVIKQFAADFPALLKERFDTVWNAFGLPGSDKFNAGHWIGVG